MQISNFKNLTPKQKQRLASKMSKSEKRDMLQPYKDGKVNDEFVKVYGEKALKTTKQSDIGSDQHHYMKEHMERLKWNANKLEGKLKKRHY